MRRALYAVAIILGLVLPELARAKCDPGSGWTVGKTCYNADNVGVRVLGADTPLQTAIDTGALTGSAASNLFEFCRNGGKGLNLDAATGLYATTCGNFNWHGSVTEAQAGASYEVTCTGSGTPHSSCLRSGERRLIGALHRVGLAVDYTMPGGTVLLPLFSGKNHGIYVDTGCGTTAAGVRNQCPRPFLADVRAKVGAAKYAVTGPHVLRYEIGAERGVRIVGEASPGYSYDQAGALQLTGVWYVADRGPAANGNLATGNDVEDGPTGNLEPPPNTLNVGGARIPSAPPYCDDTSATNPDCNEEQFVDLATTAHSFTGPAFSEFATASTILSNYTASNNQFCVNNAVSGNELTTTGTCPGDRRLRCWATGATTLRSAGGCVWDRDGSGGVTAADLDLSEGVGCQGFFDAFAYEENSRGRNLSLVVQLANCPDGATSSNDCHSSHGEQSYRADMRPTAGAGCSSTGITATLGGPAGGRGTSPYPVFFTGGGARNVYAVDDGVFGIPGGGFRQIGIMPADWYGRGTCTTGAEAACDSLTTLSVNGGNQPILEDVTIFRQSFRFVTGYTPGAGIDGQSTVFGAIINRMLFTGALRGTGFDPSSDWTFLDSQWVGNDLSSEGGAAMMAGYGRDLKYIRPRVVQNHFTQFLVAGQPVVGPTILDGEFAGNRVGGSAILFFGSASYRNVTIVRNRFTGNSGGTLVYLAPVIPSGSSSAIAYAKNFNFSDNFISGNEDGVNSGTAAPSTPFFIDDAAGVAEVLRNFRYTNNVITTGGTNVCGLWVEDDGGVTGRETARSTWRIENNSVEGTNAVPYCQGDSDAAHGDAATGAVVLASARYLPLLVQNSANTTVSFNQIEPRTGAAQVPDCDLLPQGFVATIFNDTATGACTSASGLLSGGGTAVSTCACGAAGAWSVVD